MVAKNDDEVEIVMTTTDEEKDLLPSPNLDPDLLAEGTLLPQDDPHSHNATELANEVLVGHWGSTETTQRRNLIKAGIKPGAVMAEVRRLSS